MSDSEHMDDTDLSKEDEVLKRMLRTPHTKHEPTTTLGKRRRKDRDEKSTSKCG